MREEWNGFKSGNWCEQIDVRDFIQNNYTEYTGDASFLAGPTDAMKSHTNKFVTIQPGYTKKEKIAKEILSRINEEDILSLDDVVRVLPSGKCDFV